MGECVPLKSIDFIDFFAKSDSPAGVANFKILLLYFNMLLTSFVQPFGAVGQGMHPFCSIFELSKSGIREAISSSRAGVDRSHSCIFVRQ